MTVEGRTKVKGTGESTWSHIYNDLEQIRPAGRAYKVAYEIAY